MTSCLQLFRTLIPKWSFFEAVGHSPILYIQSKSQGAYGPWRQCLVPPKRHAYELFVNPHGQLHFLKYRILQSFIQNPNSNRNEHTTEYLNLVGLVKSEALHLNPQGQELRFKIVLQTPENFKIKKIDYMISKEIRI
ncbi:MAG: hypothetical protein HOO06_13395 [Bdellovibrionaceae bacterium]|jgi:hypothetical protein|nr:hypothetical protein [Pseudobdellovibrionaceae bacterium]